MTDPITKPCGCSQANAIHQRGDQDFCAATERAADYLTKASTHFDEAEACLQRAAATTDLEAENADLRYALVHSNLAMAAPLLAGETRIRTWRAEDLLRLEEHRTQDHQHALKQLDYAADVGIATHRRIEADRQAQFADMFKRAR